MVTCPNLGPVAWYQTSRDSGNVQLIFFFFTFWNNLIWGGLVLGREIENVTSLQFSSSPFMAGEERGGADKEGWVGDKWELQDPSFLP